MALQQIPLNRIDEVQLQRLIDGKASETREIEYKRETYGNADKDYAEYLADVSSFANTIGGDLVIGRSWGWRRMAVRVTGRESFKNLGTKFESCRRRT